MPPIVLDGTTGITTPDLTDTSLTSGRVVYAGTSGNLTGSTALTFDGAILGVNGISVGRGAGAVATNTAVGSSALATNSVGTNSTAIGTEALYNMTTGPCTAVGYRAGYSVTTGDGNTFLGRYSGGNSAGSITGTTNTGVGNRALQVLTSGSNNVSVGSGSMPANTTGSANVAVGLESLYSNTTASNSTAVGYQAGYTNTTNGANSFFGGLSGYNSTGVTNTYIGYGAGYSMTSGGKNAIIGGYNGNQDGLDIRTASNYAVISDGDGNRLLSTANGQTLALDGGAVPNAGTGITFPATQSASSDANTLDDYEEGTFTPTIIGGTTAGTASYSTRTARYTKIGRVVQFDLYIAWNSGTGTGNLRVDGLPFTANGTTYQAVTVSYPNNLALSALNVAVAFIGPSSAYVDMYQYPAGGGASAVIPYDASAEIMLSGTYSI